MKKLLLILLLPLALFGQSQKISDMPAATTLSGTELVPIVQTTNKKATVAQIRGWNPLGSANQLLRVNAGATALEFFTPSYLSGVVGIANGGTGLSTLGTANQLLRVNAGGTALEYYTPSFLSDTTAFIKTQGTSILTNNVYVDFPDHSMTLGDSGRFVASIKNVTSGVGREIYIGDTTSYITMNEGVLGFGTSLLGGISNFSSGYSNNNLGFQSGGVYQAIYSQATGGGEFYGKHAFNLLNGNAHIRFVSGSTPSTLVNGDMWHTSPDLFLRVSGSTFVIPKTTSGKTTNRAAVWNSDHVLNQTTFTLPTGNGTSGDVLTTNGTGSTSWAAPSGGGGISGLTSNELVYGNSATTIASLPVATYPSLTELALLKGITGSSVQAQLDSKWNLANGGTLTGANTITGTAATNTLTFDFPDNAVSGTTRGLTLTNSTAATSGNQKWHTPFTFISQGWKTTATAGSQETLWGIQNQSIQGTTNPSSNLTFLSQINGGATNIPFLVTSAGVVVSGSSVTSTESINSYGTASITASSGNGYFNPYYKVNSAAATTGMIISLRNSSSAKVDYAYLGGDIEANTAGSHTGSMTFRTATSGTVTEKMRLNSYGQLLVGETSAGATSTRLEVKGSGTNSTDKLFSLIDAGSNDRFHIQSNAAISINGSFGTTGYKLTTNGSGSAATWEAPTISTNTTKTGTETISVNYGSLTSSAVASSSIRTNAFYSNSTTLIADITVFGIKSDGSTSVVGKVTGRYRKNSSGTFSIDDAGTAVISDITIIASIVPEINGTNPSVQVTMGAASGDYQVSFTAVCNYVTY